MGQWLSQTRKLNNHYQSTGKKTGWWIKYSAFALFGIELEDGSFAFPPAEMQEPGTTKTVFSNNKNATYGSVLYELTSLYSGKHFTTTYHEENYDIYIGIYTPSEYELECGALDVSATALSDDTFEIYKCNVQNGELIRTGDTQTLHYNEITNAIIPTLTRYPWIYYAKKTTDELPEQFSFMAEYGNGGSITINGNPIVSNYSLYLACTNLYQLVDEQLPEYNMPRITGKSPISRNSGTSTYFNSGKIAGCDFRTFSEKGEGTDADTISGQAFCSYTGIAGTSLIKYNTPRFGVIYTGMSQRETTIVVNVYSYTDGTTYNLLSVPPGNGISESAVICTGGNAPSNDTYNYYPSALSSSSGNFNPITIVNGAMCGFTRRLKSVRIQKNFTFFNGIS